MGRRRWRGASTPTPFLLLHPLQPHTHSASIGLSQKTCTYRRKKRALDRVFCVGRAVAKNAHLPSQKNALWVVFFATVRFTVAKNPDKCPNLRTVGNYMGNCRKKRTSQKKQSIRFYKSQLCIIMLAIPRTLQGSASPAKSNARGVLVVLPHAWRDSPCREVGGFEKGTLLNSCRVDVTTYE